MCRLFGLVANREVDIKFSMLEAQTSFKSLGKCNPHGWGIGWYDDKGKAHIEKYGESAFKSEKFDNLVKEITSKIFIAHVRYASSGSPCSDKNAHPFLYKDWIFAHNGTVKKERLLKLLNPPYTQGFTSEPIDSEVYFRLLLQCIEEKCDVKEGLLEGIRKVIVDDNGANFLLSDGKNLYAFRHGKELYYLERKPDGPICSYSKETNALIESKRIMGEKAVLVCSEKLTDESWKEAEEDSILIIEPDLKISVVEVN